MPRPCVISSTVSLSASVFLLCFPSPPYTSVSHRAEKKAYPALIALMPAPHPPTTKFAPSFKVWELRTVLWNQQSPSHVHVCTGPTFALEQLSRRSNCGSVHRLAYIFGGGRKQECCSGGTWGFIFSLFPTLYHDSCLPPSPPPLTEQSQE